MTRRPDYRSEEAAAYRALYRTKRWKQLRESVLVRDLFTCQQTSVILTNGKNNPRSAVVHHKRPHKGDPELFYDPDNLEAVCKAWHDGSGQKEDNRGYSVAIGPDGWPTDPQHPMNRG